MDRWGGPSVTASAPTTTAAEPAVGRSATEPLVGFLPTFRGIRCREEGGKRQVPFGGPLGPPEPIPAGAPGKRNPPGGVGAKPPP